ncbi:MAG: hypothetical protein LJE62_00360 [Silicimonas sp.]|jgi:hypothetical protein|nr:hypothetical protein [Silicimonas sp.]
MPADVEFGRPGEAFSRDIGKSGSSFGNQFFAAVQSVPFGQIGNWRSRHIRFAQSAIAQFENNWGEA